jgi:hypothetical protein
VQSRLCPRSTAPFRRAGDWGRGYAPSRPGVRGVWAPCGLLLQDAGVAAENAALRQQHEAGLAAFLLPRRRARFRESLATPRRRRKLYDELYHFDGHLDARFATLQERHTKHEGHVEQVHAVLANEGAPRTCFVLATIGLDGQEAPLRDALEELMWTGAGFLHASRARWAST